MEMVFHEQFYRIEPELTINDLVEVKQYDHESTEDFMMRFRRTRMRCQFPVNQAQLISIAQRALKLPLRKRFYDAQFNELQELVIDATKYERLLQEEQQVKHTSKVPPFYKNKAAIHRVEVGEARPEHEDGRDEEDVDVCAAEMTTPFKPLMTPEIYEELVRARFRDGIQDLIVKGKLLLDSPQASMMVDTNPFPEAPINMINLILQEAVSPFGIAGKEKGPGCHNTFA
ncbi:hypothetical protein ACFX19_014461 [Malus domestica]